MATTNYILNDWEGYFAENPRDRIDFVNTTKVFSNYADARNEAEQRFKERIAILNGADYELQVFVDVTPEFIDDVAFNEDCYIKKLFDDNYEELCTIQIVKAEYN